MAVSETDAVGGLAPSTSLPSTKGRRRSPFDYAQCRLSTTHPSDEDLSLHPSE